MTEWIVPDWPAPKNVNAVVTTRTGGLSRAPYDSFNLGAHVGDDPSHVEQNRRRLDQALSYPVKTWLNQTHSTRVVRLPCDEPQPDADASFTQTPGHVCTVMTADCLPVLFCNKAGTRVAAAHAGWRGLLDGVLENTLAEFSETDEVMAWLGPAIGPAKFEVGSEVKTAFCDKDKQASEAFRPFRDKWLADIYQLARQRLLAMGVSGIYGGNFCTVTESERFFSYRRDGKTGRMASTIWLQA